MILDRVSSLLVLMITSMESYLSSHFQHGFWLRGVQP